MLKQKVTDIPEIIVAACVLHNICSMNEDDVVDFLHEGEDDPDVNGNDDGNVNLFVLPDNIAGVETSTHITRVLS